MSVIKKKKYVTRKNKKDWRKHCDIRDVEEFLEDQRLEERLGGISGKTDSELFVIDTAGDAKDLVDEKPVLLTAKQKKRALIATTTPKCFEVFKSTSKVQDPNAKRNHVNPVGSKPQALSKLSTKRKEKSGALDRKLKEAVKNRQLARDKKKKEKQNKHAFDMDMWGNKLPSFKGIPSTLEAEFISEEAVLHNVLPDSRIRSKPPLAPTLSRQAISLPHPGVSYNPAYQEHQELLQDVCVRETYMMKKEEKIHRATTRMFSKLSAKEREEQWRSEMSAGLPDTDKTNINNESEDSDSEYKAINPPVKNKKKDHKTRRKQKERLAQQEVLKRQKINKQKITDLYKLRKLKATIEKTETRQSKTRDQRQQSRAEKSQTAVPALSKNKVPTLEPDFVEPQSLSGDLRNVKTCSNLLRERYESLQRRGALAGANIMMKKRRRMKSYFKAGHKVTDTDVQKYLADVQKNKTLGKTMRISK